MIRNLLAVLAGLAVITATSFAIEAAVDPLMMRTFSGAVPNPTSLNRNLAAWLFTMAYTLSCVFAGGYVTAWLSRRSPLRYAFILGLVQSALMVPAMLSFPDPGPLWRWIAGMLLVVPAAWSGGVIFSRQTTRVRVDSAGNVPALQ